MPHRLGRSIKITAVGAAAQNLSSPVSTKQTPPTLHLNVEENRYSGEKPYICNHCNYVDKTNAYFADHVDATQTENTLLRSNQLALVTHSGP